MSPAKTGWSFTVLPSPEGSSSKESTVPVMLVSTNNVCPSQLIQCTLLDLNFELSVQVCLSEDELGYQKLRYQGDNPLQKESYTAERWYFFT